MGRLVLTHSTYLEGLKKWGHQVSKLKGIKTVTPGTIGKTRGKVSRLTIRLSRRTPIGFKLIARNGSTYQEVYIVSDLGIDEFKTLIGVKSRNLESENR